MATATAEVSALLGAGHGSSNAAPGPADLLGKPGHGSLPVWLNPERFLTDAFSAEDCVSDLRRFVPLATLQNELQTYLASLKTKMVEVINEDYADYVSLSSRLTNVDGAVMRMRRPLLDLRDKLVVVQDAVKTELAALNQGLRRRKEVATGRSLLELMQELAHVASKVEKLLAEVQAAASKEGSGDGQDSVSTGATASGAGAAGPGEAGGVAGAWGDLDARARLLERVAGEVSRLSFQAQRGRDLAFVRAMEPRISAARREVGAYLEAALGAALSARAHSAALHCLHGYAELGEPVPAEAALRAKLVAPVVERLVLDHKAAHPARLAAGAKGDELGALLGRVLEGVWAEMGPILSAALTPQSPLRTLDVVGSVLLAEVDHALATHLPSVFSPGVPPAFHANYLAAQSFLDALESRCQGRTSLERLRGGTAYASFARRWNTSVYFSLVYQEIAGQLEDAIASLAGGGGLGAGSASGAPPGHDRPAALGAPLQGPARVRLPPSVALAEGLSRVSDPAVFLPQLADRFLRLTLQLGQRYVTWAGSLVAARKEVATTSTASASPLTPGGAPPTPGSASHGGVASTGGAGGGEGGSGNGWVGGLPVGDLAILYNDITAVAAHVGNVFAPAFGGLIKTLPDEAHAAAASALEGLAAGIQSQADALLVCVCEEVAEGCVGVARQLKGITATYRMTTKGPPTRHSHYVTGVLAPLRALLDAAPLASGPEPLRSHVAGVVVDAVSQRYQALAAELLATVRKTESSLKRLKKATAAEDSSAMSDSDKIGLQLYLDVQEYGAQVAKFGLQPDSLPSYQKLLASVAPAAPHPGGHLPPGAGHGYGSGTALAHSGSSALLRNGSGALPAEGASSSLPALAHAIPAVGGAPQAHARLGTRLSGSGAGAPGGASGTSAEADAPGLQPAVTSAAVAVAAAAGVQLAAPVLYDQAPGVSGGGGSGGGSGGGAAGEAQGEEEGDLL